MNKKQPREKLKIICGQGVHRSWNCAIAEVCMLAKYGSLPDFFWQQDQFKKEYVNFLKILSTIVKKSSKNRLAFVLSKKKSFDLSKEIGLIIWECNNLKYEPSFSFKELITQFEGKFKTQKAKEIEIKEINIEVKQNKPGLLDLLGDI